MSEFSPLLAKDFVESELRFPGWVSPKYDGIRAIVRGGRLLTRSNKLVPNRALQAKFGHLEGFDGELILGDPCAPDVFNRTTSAVRRADGPADGIAFYVFDHVTHLDWPYRQRYGLLLTEASLSGLDDVHPVLQGEVTNFEELLTYEQTWLELGFEGAMFRDPAAPYKCGRSTVKEGILLKIKRFEDCECMIIGFEEQKQNTNAAFINELGRTKRSTHAAGMVGKGTLGALIVRGLNGRFTGRVWSIGGGRGLTAEVRQQIWDRAGQVLGQTVVCEYFPIGCVDLPRFPKLKGFRMPEDL